MVYIIAEKPVGLGTHGVRCHFRDMKQYGQRKGNSMIEIPGWCYLALASLIVAFAFSLGIDCIKDANRIMRKCKRIQKYAEKEMSK